MDRSGGGFLTSPWLHHLTAYLGVVISVTVIKMINVGGRGISLTHPDLNVYRNVTLVNGTANGDDDMGHGSHVAGVAAAKDNDVGIVGVAPGARLWAIKVCDEFGECDVLDQIKGIEYAITHADEIDVINLSLENPNSPSLNKVIDEAVKAGITLVAAAGNYGEDASNTTPANNPNVITVSAIADNVLTSLKYDDMINDLNHMSKDLWFLDNQPTDEDLRWSRGISQGYYRGIKIKDPETDLFYYTDPIERISRLRRLS